MAHQAARDFQKFVHDSDNQAALASILPAHVMKHLPDFVDLVVGETNNDDVEQKLFNLIEKEDDPEAVEEMLALLPGDINHLQAQDGFPLLHMVCIYERCSTLRFLLDKPCIDVNSTDLEGWVPLLLALGACFEMLLADPRVDVNAVDNDGDTVLDRHIKHADTDCVRALLKRDDLDLNKPDAHGRSPLLRWFHCDFSEVSELKLLLCDERTLFSFRDPAGMSIKDCIPNLRPATRGEVVDLVRNHEYVRFERAKETVKILKDWCVEIAPGNEKYLPEDVLSKYVLPYVADVLSPVEEIGDITI